MSIQKTVLFLIFFCSNLFIVSCDEAPLFSEIQPVERQKFLGLMQELGKSKKSDKEIAQDARIKARIKSLLQNYAQIFRDLYENSLEQQGELDLQIFCKRVQRDQNLTSLVKNIAEVLCQEAELVTLFFKTYLDIEKGLYTDEQYLIALRSYLPKNIDIVQFFLEDFVWSFRFLYRTFELKRVITIDDICTVVDRTAFYFELPEKSKILWQDLMLAVKNGMKDANQDVRYYLISNAQEVVKDTDFYLGYKFLRSLAKFRREGLKTKGTEYEKLVDCSDLIDRIVSAVKNIERTNKLNSLLTTSEALEKLIFKK